MQIDIMVGSVLGASEYVAEAIEQYLTEQQHDVRTSFTPTISELRPSALLIICTSTHGAGDLPDNIQAFYKELDQYDLSAKSAVVIGLGDSSYDTFCNAARSMETKLHKQGANIIIPPILIDVLQHPIPEDYALAELKKSALVLA